MTLPQTLRCDLLGVYRRTKRSVHMGMWRMKDLPMYADLGKTPPAAVAVLPRNNWLTYCYKELVAAGVIEDTHGLFPKQ